ncbi:MAG: hypothetical protein WC107_03455 [Patescibacteria group bacterium]
MKKIIAASLFGLLLAGSLALSAPTANASYNMDFYNGDNIYRNAYSSMFLQRQSTYYLDQMFLYQQRLYTMPISFDINGLGNIGIARRVMIVNVDQPYNMFMIRNSNTGPFSVNRVVINVSDDLYREIVSNLSSTQTVDITVDTGNNTVSLNTVVGDVVSGDVSLSIR